MWTGLAADLASTCDCALLSLGAKLRISPAKTGQIPYLGLTGEDDTRVILRKVVLANGKDSSGGQQYVEPAQR